MSISMLSSNVFSLYSLAYLTCLKELAVFTNESLTQIICKVELQYVDNNTNRLYFETSDRLDTQSSYCLLFRLDKRVFLQVF